MDYYGEAHRGSFEPLHEVDFRLTLQAWRMAINTPQIQATNQSINLDFQGSDFIGSLALPHCGCTVKSCRDVESTMGCHGPDVCREIPCASSVYLGSLVIESSGLVDDLLKKNDVNHHVHREPHSSPDLKDDPDGVGTSSE
eukprot:TRINITY_DN18771_c0_g1_i1.p1 TRINITY_DN18771_c0_g1~~TRINITY_DN18771_c0_g1_i1.p1  ORF type:complete len:141 (-),score=16.44 TRINITY_DN18771_c0_g1_i1:188-610(-)